MLFAAVRWSLMAQSGHSRHRNNLSAFGQERTLFGSGADQHSDASVALKEVPGIARLAKNHHFWGMKPDLFRDLPEDCTCDGEGLAPVSRVPRVGAMPELVTYRCEACGHVETVEAQPKEQR